MNNKRPKYKKIKQVIKERLLTGTDNTGFLSESKLIAEFKVSATTAKKVLNDLQDEGLIERKVGKGSVIIPFSQRRNKELGVIFFDVFSPDDPHVSQIVKGIEEKARRSGCSLHLFTTRNKPFSQDSKSTLFDLVVRRKLAGVFILSPLPACDLKFISKEQIPVIVVGNDYPELDVSSVTFDLRSLLHKIGTRLVQLGYHKIAVSMTGIHLEERILRSRDLIFEGYNRFLRQHNIPFNGDYFIVSEKPNDQGYNAMETWYSFPEARRPEVIITGNFAAENGTRAFLETHRDWNPLVIPVTDDPDTECGVYCSNTRLGEESFDLLEKQLDNNNTGPEKRFIPLEYFIPKPADIERS